MDYPEGTRVLNVSVDRPAAKTPAAVVATARFQTFSVAVIDQPVLPGESRAESGRPRLIDLKWSRATPQQGSCDCFRAWRGLEVSCTANAQRSLLTRLTGLEGRSMNSDVVKPAHSKVQRLAVFYLRPKPGSSTRATGPFVVRGRSRERAEVSNCGDSR